MRERIINTLKPYSHGAITEALPTYYSELRPRIDDICRSVASVRGAKDIATSPSEDVSVYDAALQGLSSIYDQLATAVPTMEEFRNSRRFR
ncbi:hypothetical protein LCGC14_2528590, partial [marine sediment metagenome]